MKKGLGEILTVGFLAVILSGVSLAQHGGMDMAPSKNAPKQEMPMGTQSGKSMTVEGLSISLNIMDMGMHMSMQGMKGMDMNAATHSQSHEIMIKVQDTASKEIISDAKVTYTISSPSGKKDIGKLEWSGDYYGGGFSPKEKGTYQVQLKIESGGMEREAKFTYEAK